MAAASLAAVAVTALALAGGCSPADHSPATMARTTPTTPLTIVVDGQAIDAARLLEAVDGLCEARQEAAAEPTAAKATYDRRAHDVVDATAQALLSSYELLASSITEVVGRLEAAMATDAARAAMADELARLTGLMREALARLGVTTEACPT